MKKVSYDKAWKAVKAFEEGKKLYAKSSHTTWVRLENVPDVVRYLYRLYEE